jgi:uncharacterized protein YhhL (DUF1145 family)
LELGVNKVQSQHVPRSSRTDLLLKVILSSPKTSDVLARVWRNHGIDFGNKSHPDSVWTVVVLGRGMDPRQHNFCIELAGGIALNMHGLDLVLLRNRAPSAERNHLAPTTDFELVTQLLFDGRLQRGAIDFFRRVWKPADARCILGLDRTPTHPKVLSLSHQRKSSLSSFGSLSWPSQRRMHGKPPATLGCAWWKHCLKAPMVLGMEATLLKLG